MESAESPRSVGLEDDAPKMDQARGAEAAVSDGLNTMASFILDTLQGSERESRKLKSGFVVFGSQSAIIYDGQSCGVYDSEALVCRDCTDAELAFMQEHSDPGGINL